MNKITSVVLCLFLVYPHLACAEDLLTVYQQAIDADPTLKSAGIKTEIGAAQKGQALGEMLPQVSASANWSANNQRQIGFITANTSNYHGTRYTLSLNQSVIDFAKFWNWRKAQEIEDQYNSELTEAQHTLMVHVVEKYFGVLEAEDQLSFLQTERQSTEKQLEQINRQFSKSLVKITDLYDVEARLDQIKASEIEAETILNTAIESLKELTNTTPDTFYRLRESIDYKHLEGNLEDWISVAKSENPTLAA